LEIGKSVAGNTIGIPLVVLHGASDGPVLVVDAATHGDEVEGPLALLELLRATDPTKMKGTLVGVPGLNIEALEAVTRGNPFEIHHYDLNRSYPGERDGSITERIAALYLENVVKRADACLALHGGGTPFYLDGFVIAQDAGGNSLELVRAIGWKRFTDSPDTSVGSGSYKGNLTSYCREYGIPSLTVEMGGASFRAPSQLDRTKREFIRGIRNVMIHYGLIEGKPDRPSTLWRISKKNFRANNGGIISLEEGIDADVEVKKGQKLLTIFDIFGNVVEEHEAPFDGRVMGLPGSPVTYPGRIVASVYKVVEEIPTEL